MSDRPANAFLRSLGAQAFESLATHLVTVDLAPGTILTEPDRKVDHVYFPLSAVLSMITTTGSGEQVETSMVGNEGALGVTEVCGSGVSIVTSVVQVDGRVMRAPAATFRRLIAADEDLWSAAWRVVELQIGESRQSGMCQAFHGVEPRLARWLLECSERAGGRAEMPLTQEFLAAMLGVQRTTVTAFAAQLQKAGLIRYARGRLDIIDAAALEGVSCECRHVLTAQRRRLGLETLPVATGGLRVVEGGLTQLGG